MTGFSVQVFSNEYLPPGGTLRFTPWPRSPPMGRTATGPSATEAIEVLVLDSSGSMQTDGRIHEARRALAAAVNQIRDGVWFSVVAGTEVARLVTPRRKRLPGYHSGAVSGRRDDPQSGA